MTIFNKIRFFFRAFMWGLRHADNKMLSQTSNSKGDGTGISMKQEKPGTLAEDLIMKEETERVKELRDEHYRVYRESGKYKVDTSKLQMGVDENGNSIWVIPEDYHMEKKEDATSKIPSEIITTEGEKIVVVQHNYAITESLSDTDINESKPVRYKLKVESSVFRKFKIEKYTKYIAVKKNDDDETFIEFYCSIFPREFVVMKGMREKGTIDKSDVFFIKEAEDIIGGKVLKSDIFSFDTVEFITEHAYNKDDLFLYNYANGGFLDCEKYGNYFVFRFKGIPVVEGHDIIAQYRLESVDKKYAEKQQKNDIFQVNELTLSEKY